MTIHNRAFWRALRSLAHPVTISAVILLLLNDHVLRIAWPSWWTGKLGDAAWLAFFPLIVAALLALLVPPMLRRQEEIVAWLAFGLTGLVFTLMKTIPAAMDAGLWLLSQVLYGPFTLRVDPTDLLALPALGVGWTIWTRSEEKQLPLRRGWMMLALGALASIATSAPAQVGTYCLGVIEDGYVRSSWGPQVVSKDGGLTWERSSEWDDDGAVSCMKRTNPSVWELTDPRDDSIQYRFTAGVGVERSIDSGRTWSQELNLSLTDAETAYLESSDFYPLQPGPLDAVIHPRSGNVIVAMGIEGVYVRTQDGKWTGVNVDKYQVSRANIYDFEKMSSFLNVKWLLAIILFCSSSGILSIFTKQSGSSTVITVLGTGLVLPGGILLVISSPAQQTFDSAPFIRISSWVLLIIAIVWGISGINQLQRALSSVPWELILTSIIAPLLFILPYYLWLANVIPSHFIATSVALALTVATIGAGAWRLKRRLDDLPDDE